MSLPTTLPRWRALLLFPLLLACGEADDANPSTPSATDPGPTSPTPTNQPAPINTFTPSPPAVDPGPGPIEPVPVEPSPIEPGPALDNWPEVYGIMQLKCNGAYCHATGGFPPQLVGDELTVKPQAELKRSQIGFRVITQSGLPSSMPPIGAPELSGPELEAIRIWTGL